MCCCCVIGLRPMHNDLFPQPSDLSADRLLRDRVAEAIVRKCGGSGAVAERIGAILRQAYDEVIDMPRTGRWSIAQLEKTEKTYIGTKVEILVRHMLGAAKGNKLDLSIDGVEVDIKNSVGTSWSIPEEALGEVCLGILGDDKAGRFSVGVFIPRGELLNEGRNRDRKGTLSRAGRQEVRWLSENALMPPNVFEKMPASVREEILNPDVGGTERLSRFLCANPYKELTRNLVLSIAQQRDPMKRLRKNGGVRDVLMEKGFRLLSGRDDRNELDVLGLQIAPDSFVCVPVALDIPKRA